MTEKKNKYLYGPVPSRRLGRSLGVDVIPLKTCTLNCIYCQLGRTPKTTTERKDYLPIAEILSELQQRLAEGLDADYITIGGSGEPTLHSRLGELIDGIRKITAIPVAILTNGTLLYRPDVRADCAKADVVAPSLDVGDEQAFETINRPHPDITIEKLIDGLGRFRDEYPGRIWLEVFLIEGFNTDTDQIAKLKSAIERIRPDKVHLNTAVRPTAETGVEKVSREKLIRIAEQLGPQCEVIADFISAHCGLTPGDLAQTVLSMLKRRPCSLGDISSGLGIHRNEVSRCISQLQKQGSVCSEEKGGIIFYKVR